MAVTSPLTPPAVEMRPLSSLSSIPPKNGGANDFSSSSDFCRSSTISLGNIAVQLPRESGLLQVSLGSEPIFDHSSQVVEKMELSSKDKLSQAILCPTPTSTDSNLSMRLDRSQTNLLSVNLNSSAFSDTPIANTTLQSSSGSNFSSSSSSSLSSATTISDSSSLIIMELARILAEDPDLLAQSEDPQTDVLIKGLKNRASILAKTCHVNSKVVKNVEANDVGQKNMLKERRKQDALRNTEGLARKAEESACRDVLRLAYEYFKENRREFQRVKRILEGDHSIPGIASVQITVSSSSNPNQFDVETELSIAEKHLTNWGKNLAERSHFPVKKTISKLDRLLRRQARFSMGLEISKLPNELIRDHQFLKQKEEQYQKLLKVTREEVAKEFEEKRNKVRKITTESTVTENAQVKIDVKKLSSLRRAEFRIKGTIGNFLGCWDASQEISKKIKEQERYERVISRYHKDLRLCNADFVEDDRMAFDNLLRKKRLGITCVRMIDNMNIANLYFRSKCLARNILAEKGWTNQTTSLIAAFLCTPIRDNKRCFSLDMRLSPIYNRYLSSIPWPRLKPESDIPPTAYIRVQIYLEDHDLENEVGDIDFRMQGEKLIITCTLSAPHYMDREKHAKGMEKNFENYRDVEIIFKKEGA